MLRLKGYTLVLRLDIKILSGRRVIKKGITVKCVEIWCQPAAVSGRW